MHRHFTLSPRILSGDLVYFYISLPEFTQYVDDHSAFRARQVLAFGELTWTFCIAASAGPGGLRRVTDSVDILVNSP
jgi:hypothetical protein